MTILIDERETTSDETFNPEPELATLTPAKVPPAQDIEKRERRAGSYRAAAMILSLLSILTLVAAPITAVVTKDWHYAAYLAGGSIVLLVLAGIVSRGARLDWITPDEAGHDSAHFFASLKAHDEIADQAHAQNVEDMERRNVSYYEELDETSAAPVPRPSARTEVPAVVAADRIAVLTLIRERGDEATAVELIEAITALPLPRPRYW